MKIAYYYYSAVALQQLILIVAGGVDSENDAASDLIVEKQEVFNADRHRVRSSLRVRHSYPSTSLTVSKEQQEEEEEEEEGAASTICSLPKEVGPCKALIPRYYYDAKKERCERFNYGGCRGNQNNFESSKSCQDECGIGEGNVDGFGNEGREEPTTSVGAGGKGGAGGSGGIGGIDGPGGSDGADGSIICPEPTDHCMNEDNYAQCQDLVDNGCKTISTLLSCPVKFVCGDYDIDIPSGTTSDVNNNDDRLCCESNDMPRCFIGIAECCPLDGMWSCPNGESNIYRCGGSRIEGPLGGETCPDNNTCPEMSPETGDTCDERAIDPNYIDKRCCYGEESCCGKTHESFCCHCFRDTWACYNTDACMNPCPPVPPICSLPPDSGWCEAYFPRYYYNAAVGECETFVYGGCDGNQNNFETQAECMEACSE